ncbi:integrase catalytic domain-containing protein, partial [Haematococcus lacustris]
MDVCGPMPNAGRDGSRYIATFLDEHTGLSVIQLLTSKDQVPTAVQRVITELETQSGQRCKALRSDNGSEYSNKTMSAWCSSKGIQQQFSAPYCPEQNGKAERLNRTIMQHATNSSAASWFLGQLVTPWEAFYHRKPNLSALRVFGATAWVYVTQPNRNKLQPKAVKGIFVGYAVGSKAYKVWVNGRLEWIDETAVLNHHRSMQLPVQSPVTSV